MTAFQKTIQKECSIAGVGLHTGEKVTLKFKPALENSGIRFIRVDLPGPHKIEAKFSNVLLKNRLPRCTSLQKDGVVIHTVEHLMSVLNGLEVDNLIVEIDGSELPGLDGSGIEFLKIFKKVGIVEQKSPRSYFSILEPEGIEEGDSYLYITPSADFRVSYTLDYKHSYLKSQFYSATLEKDIYEREIASCRTFCLDSEANELRAHGLGKGANHDNTLVVGEKGVISNQLRFPNEFARHKVLDLIGDLYLLGMPIRGHVIAIKSGHDLNLKLLKKICQQKESLNVEDKNLICQYNFENKKEFNIHDIMKLLPHRYPFLLVDRVYEIEKGKKVVGIKNVTVNDSFFQGHFPSRPVMPGVLILEAMAQAAGVSVLSNKSHHGMIAFFMAADKVKLRKVVTPGDQLFLEVEMIRDRPSTASIRGQAKVDGELVAEAEMLFSFRDASYLS